MLNLKIEKRVKNNNDYGLYAIDIIYKNEIIWQPDENEKNNSILLTLQEIEKLTEEQKKVFLKYSYQIDINLFSGEIDLKEVEKDISYYMNHSCDPNAWYEGNILVARRDILINEEICYDYGTDTTDRDWNFICNCGAKNCRKKIKKDDFKKIRDIYKNHFITYILKNYF